MGCSVLLLAETQAQFSAVGPHMLTLVQGPPWERQPDETDPEYYAFLSWLMARPRPTPAATQLAGTRLWAERAAAFDQHVQRPAKAKDQVLAISQNLFALADLEAEKLRRKAFATDQPTLTVKDLITLCAYLAQIKDTLKDLLDDKDDLDWENLTDAQLDELSRAHSILKTMTKAG
jgi:hypothetical protein